MKKETKILFYLICFAVFDLVIPFPITAVILIYVLIEKPLWFIKLVKGLYEKSETDKPETD